MIYKKTDSKYLILLKNNRERYHKNRPARQKQMKDNWNKNKAIRSTYKKMYYLLNKEKIKEKVKLYREKNKDKIKAMNKIYWEKNKIRLKDSGIQRYRTWYINRDKAAYRAKKRIYEKLKRKIDPQYAIKKRLRLRVWQKLKDIKKGHSDEYGINYQKIVNHLKSNIPSDYLNNPSNYQIDHITPLSKFNLTKPSEIREAFAPENHQWLTAKENRKKGSKLNKPT